jgi:regulator of sigma D
MNVLVQQLRQQHEALRTSVRTVTEHADVEPPVGDVVARDLDAFRTLLNEHLAIEDTTFYPLLLQRLEAEQMDTTATKLFIGEMADIGERVYGFLNAYPTGEDVTRDVAAFRTRLHDVAAALAGRMQAEDKAVYELYERLTE